MRFHSWLFSAAAMVLAIPAAQADIVANGGFETGNLTGWTATFAFSSNVRTYNFDGEYNPHSGGYFYTFGDSFNVTLSQGITDTPGQTLVLQYYFSSEGGTPTSFAAYWNGVAIDGSLLTSPPGNPFVIDSPPPFDEHRTYDKYTFAVQATGADTLSFVGSNPPNYFALDDISLNGATCSVASDTIVNPLTHLSQPVQNLTCPYGPPNATSLTAPMQISGVQEITSVAPPNSQYYGFSAPASTFDIGFSSPDSSFNGILNLYNSSYLLLDSSAISGGLGELDSTGLTVGANYILGVTYDAPADPAFRLAFSSPLAAAVSAVPEPVSLSLFGAGLAGAIALRRRKAKA